MDGLTISSANRFLETGSLENKSKIESPASSKEAGPSFADTLKEAVQSVNQLSLESDYKAQELATGKTDDIAGVMIATEKADIALRAMVQVRNKIIDAYQEIMRMQV
jgi:flagellar hook-basal body complex protein FliE